MTYSSDSKQAVGNQEIVKLLSHYFSNRSQFLSQVIKADLQSYILLKTHIPHPKLSQREITERKNQSEHKNKHKERKKAFEKQ